MKKYDKHTLLGGLQSNIAKKNRQAQIIQQNADLVEIEEKKSAAIAQYEQAGQDPERINEALRIERRWRALRNGERAFIVIAALFGGGFTFLAVELPLAWWALLPLLLAIWLALSWALTLALRTGVQVAFGVEPDNPQGQKRAEAAFAVAFVVFLLAFALNITSRLTPIHPAVFGITAVMIEMAALGCAACLGALAHAVGYVVALVKLILDLQHQLNITQGMLQLNQERLGQFDEPESHQQKLLN